MRVNEDELRSALLRKDFSFFLRYAYAEVGGADPYTHNWHIDAIAHQLNRVRLGKTTRLITTMPPRHLKTITITIAWVARMLGQDPSLRFICPSYGSDLSEKPARDCLRIMSTDWYRRAFPGTRLTQRKVMDFETSAGGGRLSTSVGGVLTGRGADIMIIDDPMKADDVFSEARREDVMEWFSHAAMSRLNNQAKSSIIVVMQRLHEGDLAGELLRKGGWDELRLPAIAPADELIPLTNGRMHQRRADCALHPARQSLATLKARQADEPYVFAAQWQQDPVARIGAFVSKESFKFYDDPPRTGVMCLSLDTAVKQTVRSDWSVGILSRYYEGRFYIIDVYRERATYGQLLDWVKAACIKHKVERLLIEDASSGQQLIQQLREKQTPGVPRPIAITPLTDKISRFEAQASKIESGDVVLPRTAPWSAEFVHELVSFPGGRHDDQADALAQLLGNPPPTRQVPANGDPELIEPGDYLKVTRELRQFYLDNGYQPDGSDFDPWLD